MSSTFDSVIRNGKIFDGTGNPWYKADIGIADGKIKTISNRIMDENADRIIDAKGKVVSPGFIDTHSHDDAYVIIDPQCSQKVLQGVTTTVIGNCGFSLTPMADEHCDDWKMASALMGGGRLDDEFWTLRSFNQYLDRLDAITLGINVVPLVGHGTIRVAVMGCIVNGPGEAADANVALIAGTREGFIYRDGQRVARVPADKLVDALVREVKNYETPCT